MSTVLTQKNLQNLYAFAYEVKKMLKDCMMDYYNLIDLLVIDDEKFSHVNSWTNSFTNRIFFPRKINFWLAKYGGS